MFLFIAFLICRCTTDFPFRFFFIFIFFKYKILRESPEDGFLWLDQHGLPDLCPRYAARFWKKTPDDQGCDMEGKDVAVSFLDVS